ncbi:uncharacterized protein ACLA_044260 [Aspergillus clavatus NRRL 1]|uniref:Uncharacterized protein n=1 Tax=Aspergillus clavatus (strain ATCC 1007 / CBS 513.65 / DSM 816 / NCTC 3887 / NRRL 1 / QM 1276 / 107) TaxID=344612 RepID=A1C8R9_ASPCL|nr:uncharacterized protein ACLA_044260 [Aspergillus clavatus NRRL 1]EAW13706.1 hypothetical protein ACLA_044260 [Aspergillus clavatus NRRL 1]
MWREVATHQQRPPSPQTDSSGLLVEIGAGFLHRDDEERYPLEEEGDNGADLQEGIDPLIVGVGVRKMDGLGGVTPAPETHRWLGNW